MLRETKIRQLEVICSNRYIVKGLPPLIIPKFEIELIFFFYLGERRKIKKNPLRNGVVL